MKKRLCIIVAVCAMALCAMFMCAGCSASAENKPELKEATVSSPTIIEDGVLRVGVDAESSPLAGMSNDDIIGIDVDVAASIADELGLKLSIVDVGSDPAGAVDSGNVDIVMGVNEDSDAFESLWTTEEYLPKGVVLFALGSSDAQAPSTSDDVKIAAQISSTSAWAVTNSFGDQALTSTTNLQEAFSYLESGNVNYVAADAVIGMYAARVQDVDVTAVALLTAPSGYHVGVSKENADLQTAVGDALNTLIDGGVVNIIETKWLGQPVNLDLTRIEMTTDVGEEAQENEDDGSISAVTSEEAEALAQESEAEAAAAAAAADAAAAGAAAANTTSSDATEESSTAGSGTTSNYDYDDDDYGYDDDDEDYDYDYDDYGYDDDDEDYDYDYDYDREDEDED